MKKINKYKVFITLISILFLSSCAHNGSSARIKDPEQITKDETKYYISDVKIKFSEGMLNRATNQDFSGFMNKDFSSYPDEKELSKILKNLLEENLTKKNLLSSSTDKSESFSIIINADYERLGVMWFKTAYNSFIISYDVEIYNKKEKLTTLSKRDQVISVNILFKFFHDLKAVFGLRNQKDEVSDLNILAKSIASYVSEYGK